MLTKSVRLISPDTQSKFRRKKPHEGLTEKNVVAGFERTGIFPLDKSKYPTNRFNPVLLKRYNQWDAVGRPESMDELTLTPRKGAQSSSTSLIRTPSTRRPLLETSTPTQCAEKHGCCEQLRQAGIKPLNPHLGKKWILTWGLVDSSQNVDDNNSPRSEIISTSFQEVIIQKKKKADDGTVESEPKKRRKIESKSRVVTSDEFTAEIEAKEKEKQKKTKVVSKNEAGPSKVSKKSAKSKKAPAKKERKAKWTNFCTDVRENNFSSEEEDDDEEVEDEVVEWSDRDDEDSANISTVDIVEHVEPQAQNMFPQIRKIQSELDDDKRGMYYAVYYDQRYFWGNLTKFFAEDVESDVTAVKIKFLQYKADGIWDYPKQPDISIVSAKFIFFGPVTPAEIITGKGYKFAEDKDAAILYKQLKKADFYKGVAST